MLKSLYLLRNAQPVKVNVFDSITELTVVILCDKIVYTFRIDSFNTVTQFAEAKPQATNCD